MSAAAQAPGKRHAQVGVHRIAFVEVGDGPPVLLLHGCPFSSFVWRHVVTELSSAFRCVAPDLLGLGDTETPAGADWSLPAQMAAMLGLLDRLGLERVAVACTEGTRGDVWCCCGS
jgi:pimeloyl-ACP methyl ester carboxylesterase